MERLELDARLSALCAQVPRCAMLADIGCDHGYLSAYLLASGRCDRAQLCEISAPSLEKARRLLDRLGLSGRARFLVGDGAQALEQPCDAAVIAGMGGSTIAGIVERGARQLMGARLILQPNVGASELRERLGGCGFRIAHEELARASGRWYLILVAEAGAEALSERQVLVGPRLLERRPPELAGYARFRLRVAERARVGAERGDARRARELAAEARMWEEVLMWPDESPT